MRYHHAQAIAVRWCVAVLCCAVLRHPARAGALEGPRRDPEAVRLLTDVNKAYRALAGYADRGEVVAKGSFTDAQALQRFGGLEESSKLGLTFQRPDRFVIETDKHEVISDGETLVIANKPFKQYISKPARKTKEIGTRSITSGLDVMSSMELLLDVPLTFAAETLIGLVSGDDPQDALLGEGASLEAEPDHELDGKKAKSLLIREESGKSKSHIRLLIDPDSKLVRRIEYSETDHEMTSSIVWTARSISTAAPAAGAFTFRPPAGFERAQGNTLKGTAALSMTKSFAKGFFRGLIKGAGGKQP